MDRMVKLTDEDYTTQLSLEKSLKALIPFPSGVNAFDTAS